ncbi:MAG TPA: LacI family DNA-binding transcriptional regulator [Candidatus Methylacidiphilales bacterium]
MHRQRVSLRDVGKAAGFSHVTVSFALRNHPSVPPKTAERIKAVAAQLGYKPDPMLRALAEYRRSRRPARYQGSLAWINNYPHPEQLEDNYEYALYHQGAAKRAGELGYQVVSLTPTVQKMSGEKLRRVLTNRGIQGLLLPPQPASHAVFDFDFTGFSAVAFGFTLASPQLHVIANCQYRSSMIAVRALRELGHRRIGFLISQHLNERSEGTFLGGFLSEQNAFPLKDRLPVRVWEKHPGAEERKDLLGWARRNRPDAIITDNVHWVREVLREIAIHVPEDLSLAALTAGPKTTGYAGIDQNDLEIGSRAVDALVGMIYRNETGVPENPCRILVESTWRTGATVLSRA